MRTILITVRAVDALPPRDLPPSPALIAATLVPLRDYELIRSPYRRRMIAHRQARSMVLGRWMRLQFEDEASVRYQIQEVLRCERISDPALVRQEVDTWTRLLPDSRSWTATLMIELPDAEERRRLLPLLNDAVHALELRLSAGPVVAARVNEDLPDRHRGRPSAVHFVQFALPADARAALQSGSAARLCCTHPQLALQTDLDAALLRRLCADVASSPAAVVTSTAARTPVLCHVPA